MWIHILEFEIELYIFPYGLVVRIAGSHPAGPGSIPGVGKRFLSNYKKAILRVLQEFTYYYFYFLQ